MSVNLLPRISEKAIGLAEAGTYAFEVPMHSNKTEIARAVEQNFKVKVVQVNILIQKGKPVARRFSKRPAHRSDVKKALVKLKKGDTIKLFEGAK